MHLYLHIPFCKQACHYCDFHFSTNLKSKADLVAAICRELELQKDYLPTRELETIYFGGGTPSLLTEAELGQIFDTIHQFYRVHPSAEITLEANPDDLTAEKLISLKPYINRLSIGLQSFHEPYLRFMNRAHNAAESEASVKRAQDHGFDNLTIDLMYGMSEKMLGMEESETASEDRVWQKDLEMAVALNTPHISAYNLTIEPKTVLGNWLKKGKIKSVNEELSARHFEQMIMYLNASRYEQYEISNFARDGHYARHNSSYWKRRPYLGVGPSAHSFNGPSRQYNIANNALYIQSLTEERLPFEMEILTSYDQVNDYLLTSLRTIWGCDLRIIQELAGIDLRETHKKYLNAFMDYGWVFIEDNVLFLTYNGKLFADRIASDLFVV
ncbi:radical SAM family heme chaperone HemW [Runella slithyformis]|uniref:Heme chaperone HemW n=1 Tax=Runella slithyformis (strain ATCC 29530 / DSM 19594 / LMG 11500 / NCIMB 11436 / LSU 4) TaxID=761193 RepID=A0A7U4E568_RUNSL|nr:radical SAM family heme chaperone HemW [Runella slithyformis]AEI48024.1 oxygen-independent coproporphyrinogen III oxidase [Runella slithyformis DSM 19594]